MLKVYTDGSYRNQSEEGAWAYVKVLPYINEKTVKSGILRKKTSSGYMELYAVYKALLNIPGDVEICTDSTYVISSIENRYKEKWLKKRRSEQTMKLLEKTIKLIEGREVIFTKVKSKSGNNKVADKLARKALKKYGR